MTKTLNIETSGKILKSKIVDWFSKNRPLENPIFYESGKMVHTSQLSGELSVVVYGDFLFAVSEWIELAQNEKIKFFVISRRAKQVLDHFFPGIGASVEVIPRYQLFPIQTSPPPLPEKGQEWELIFSGRISPSKNILLLLHLVSILQNKHGEKVILKLIGEFDDYANIANFEKPFPLRHETIVKEAIHNLPWISEPEIIHGEDELSWTRHLKKNSVVISLSDNWAEDFGVSLAQAEALGFPLIITDMGGQADILSSTSLKIPSHLVHDEELSNYLDTWTYSNIRAKKIAKLISLRPHPELTPSSKDDIQPKSFIQPSSFKNDLLKLNRKGIFPQFSYKYLWHKPNDAHRDFWNQYYSIWGSGKVSHDLLFILSPRALTWTSVRISMEAILNSWMDETEITTRIAIMHSGSSDQLRKYLSKSLRKVVFIGFYHGEIQIAETIRSFLPLVKFFIYPFEQPSLLYHYMKIHDGEKILNQQDVLIVTGERDKKLTELSFENAQVQYCNYFTPARFNFLPFYKRQGATTYYYAGRISEQKGLHFIIWAMYFQLKDEGVCPNLEIIGEEDGWGSTHHGISSQDYLGFLKWLIKKLNLTDRVLFRGKLHRETILRECAERKLIVVSTSVHSDENFGIFLSEGLFHGSLAVLTDWGGHQSLINQFPLAVYSVEVSQNKSTLMVNPFKLQHSFRKALASSVSYQSNIPTLPNHLNVGSTIEGTFKETPFRTKHFEKKLNSKKFLKRNQVFDFDDDQETIHQMRTIYGAKNLPSALDAQIYTLSPWTTIETNKIYVDDPLLERKIFFRDGNSEIIILDFDSKSEVLVSLKEFEWLYDLGQLYDNNLGKTSSSKA